MPRTDPTFIRKLRGEDKQETLARALGCDRSTYSLLEKDNIEISERGDYSIKQRLCKLANHHKLAQELSEDERWRLFVIDEDRLYIRRQNIEHNALGRLEEPQQPVVLYGPARCGLSWVMNNIVKRSKLHRGIESITITKLGRESGIVVGDDFASLCHQITGLVLKRGEDALRAWLQPKLTSSQSPAIWIINHGEELLDASLSVQSAFLGVLRQLCNPQDNVWSRFRLMLVLHIPPHAIREYGHSPFQNLVPFPQELQDFDELQMLELAKKRGVDLSIEQIHRLYLLIAGHPQLTDNVFEGIALKCFQLENVLAKPLNGVFEGHLRELRQMLTERHELQSDWAAFLKDPESLDISQISRLYNAGLIISVEPGSKTTKYRVRCPLYEQALRR